MVPLKLLELGPTDLTWEEMNSSKLIFKGEYLETIDKSFEAFKKEYQARYNKSKKKAQPNNKSVLKVKFGS